MLSSSATETGTAVDLRGIVDPGVDIGVPGAAELVRVGQSSVGIDSDGSAVVAVADVLGPEAAVKSACVAGAFEILNRIVDATGLPVGPHSREMARDTIEILGLGSFPHASH